MFSELSDIINKIQNYINDGGMTSENVKEVTDALNQLGYAYDYKTFPKLVNTNQLENTSQDSPNSLAEALLWKLGKWKSYKKFCLQYETASPKPTKTDVVFYAFAQHLSDNNKPIYDQHTLRAMWAVNQKLSSDEKSQIRNSLLTKKEQWKQTMNGKHMIDCYKIYCKHINEIAKDGASLKEIDLLLMPLGQAIKKQTESLQEFQQLVGTNFG